MAAEDAFMFQAAQEALAGPRAGDGGPFGCVVVDAEGRIVARAHNTVLSSHDPTAHAEVNAIRQACAARGTHDLSGCVLYASCEPCPMCLSAIVWADIDAVFYGCTRADAAAAGFRDEDIYDYLAGGEAPLDIRELDRAMCLEAFEEYKRSGGVLY